MKPYNAFLYRGNADTGALSELNVYAYTNIVDYVGTTNQATASITLNSDGTVTLSAFGDGATWHNEPASGLGASFWAIVTLTSGTLTSGTTGSRVALTNGQSWTITTTGSSSLRTKNVLGTIQLWDAAAAGTMVSSGTFKLDAKIEANRSSGGGGGGGGSGYDDPFLGQPIQKV